MLNPLGVTGGLCFRVGPGNQPLQRAVPAFKPSPDPPFLFSSKLAFVLFCFIFQTVAQNGLELAEDDLELLVILPVPPCCYDG